MSGHGSRVNIITLVKDGVEKLGFGVGGPAEDEERTGIFVDTVLRDSMASSRGVRTGMQLIRIDGEDFSQKTADEARRAIMSGTGTKIEFADIITPTRKMQLCHKELLQVVRNHVQILSGTIQCFIEPFRNRDASKIPMYFSNFEKVTHANQELLRHLETDAMETGGDCVSGCFMRVMMPMREHIKYIGETKFLQREIGYLLASKVPKERHEYKYIQQYLEEGFKNAESFICPDGQPLSKVPLVHDLLCRPGQMIMRYPMMVGSILKQMKKIRPPHPDLHELNRCHKRLKHLAAEVDSTKSQYDNLFEISKHLKDYGNEPVHLLGRLVHQGTLKIKHIIGSDQTSGKRSLSIFAPPPSLISQRMVFLFSNEQHMFLIMTEEKVIQRARESTGRPQIVNYFYKGKLVMQKDTILMLGDLNSRPSEEFSNAWTVECQKALFSLSASTVEIRERWMLHMQAEIDKLMGKRRMDSIEKLKMHKPMWEKNRYELDYEVKIGEGKFCEVWKGVYAGEQQVAIKKMKTNLDPANFAKEFGVLKELDHENIVKLYGICSGALPLLILTEYMNAGNLREFLFDGLGARMDLGELILIGREIVSGMIHLSDKHIVHRDLRAENVLMGYDLEGCLRAKVGDFGLARLTTYDTAYIAKCGQKFPVRWTAPEAIIYGLYTTKSDVWSFGVTLYEVLTKGEQPYPGFGFNDVMDKVVNKPANAKTYRMACPVISDFPKQCVQAVHDVSMNCWQQDAKLRPDFVAVGEQLKAIDVATQAVGSVPWSSISDLLRVSVGVNQFHTTHAIETCRGSLQYSNEERKDVFVTRIKDEGAFKSIGSAIAEEPILKQLRHDNIVNFYGLSANDTYRVCSIEEFFCHNGTVYSFLQRFKESSHIAAHQHGMTSLINIACQVTHGMSYLHHIGLYHGGLCSKHISYGRGGQCKIGNLFYSRNRRYGFNTAFDRWVAPEIFYTEQSTFAGDSWSFGIFFWELLSMGETPYSEIEDDGDVAQYVRRGDAKLKRPGKAVRALWSVILSCRVIKPSNRPSFAALHSRMIDTVNDQLDVNASKIQKWWLRCKQRFAFRKAVVMKLDNWRRDLPRLKLWCELRFEIPYMQLTFDEKEEKIETVQNDIAWIKKKAMEAGTRPSDEDILKAFTEAKGELDKTVELVSPKISGDADLNIRRPQPTDTGWPLEVSIEEIQELLQDMTPQHLEDFVEDDYIIDFEQYLESLGYTLGDAVSTAVAQRITQDLKRCLGKMHRPAVRRDSNGMLPRGLSK
eukprot:m.230973 g.230973  ORF g.230973 m.230973 type:complete len:1262 (+) comp33592_c1_seq1:64-3849(+)